MRCDKCGERMRVTHVFEVEGNMRARAVYCRPCDVRYTSVEFLVGPIVKQGDGPLAIAARIERLGLKPSLNGNGNH